MKSIIQRLVQETVEAVARFTSDVFPTTKGASRFSGRHVVVFAYDFNRGHKAESKCFHPLQRFGMVGLLVAVLAGCTKPDVPKQQPSDTTQAHQHESEKAEE